MGNTANAHPDIPMNERGTLMELPAGKRPVLRRHGTRPVAAAFGKIDFL
jgi:hypothetical protein